VRNTIHLGAKAGRQVNLTTRLHRWFEEERGHLLAAMCYAPFVPDLWQGVVPKLNTAALISAFESAVKGGRRMSHSFAARKTKHVLHFKKTAYNWLTFCRKLPPCYGRDGKLIPHTKFGTACFADTTSRDVAYALLNGKLQLAFWIAVGDDFDLTQWMFADFPLDVSKLSAAVVQSILAKVDELETAMEAATSFKLNAGKRVGNYNVARCRGVTDLIDRAVGEAVGFGDVMEDIELLYAQVVRTDFGDDDDGGDDAEE
jgi:hypothetical protein